MAKKEHLDIIKLGVDVWNKWRKSNPEEKPDLSGVNLSVENLCNANLSGANLWEIDLKKARLRWADLSGADICFASISGADLAGANLRGANLTEADLSRANLSGANLSKTNLWGSNLTGADFSFSYMREANVSDAKFIEAKLSSTDFCNAELNNADFTDAMIELCIFGDVDLSVAKGLETVRHYAPSTIGIDTFYRSGGNIPPIFLRGAGVPESFMMQCASLDKTPVQLFSCFISCADDDLMFAKQLCSDLYTEGFRCWIVSEDAKVKSKANIEFGFPQSIFRIPHSVVMSVLSRISVDREWMELEMYALFRQERRRKKKILFPVILDSIVMKAKHTWTGEVRNRQVSDFTRWNDHNAYKASFSRLLKDISPAFPEMLNQKTYRDFSYTPVSIPSGSIEAEYKIIGENNCPLYEFQDRIRLSGRTLIVPRDKATCVILVQDILEAVLKYRTLGNNAKSYTFSCSGCSGMIRLSYQKDTIETVKRSDSETAAIVKMLSGFEVFQVLEVNDIRDLVSFLKLKKFEKGDTIIRKGDAGRNLFIIASGKVEVIGEGGISIAFMGKGEVFGEMSLLSGKPVGATIKVVEPSEVLYLSSRDFRNVLNKFPSLQMYFTRLLAQRLAEIHVVRSEEFASGMVGKLSEMPPSELFQTLNINQKTGVLSLMLLKGSAEVYFRQGSLIGATYGEKQGKDAFFAILKEKDGRFKFIPGLTPDKIETPELGDFMWLLMEGARQIDEENI